MDIKETRVSRSSGRFGFGLISAISLNLPVGIPRLFPRRLEAMGSSGALRGSPPLGGVRRGPSGAEARGGTPPPNFAFVFIPVPLTSASLPTPSSPAESPPPAWPAPPGSPSAAYAALPHAPPLCTDSNSDHNPAPRYPPWPRRNSAPCAPASAPSRPAAPTAPAHPEVVLRMLRRRQSHPGHGPLLLFRQQGRPLIVQAAPVGLHVVEPYPIRAAGMGLGEKQDSRGHARIGPEHPAGQGNHPVQLLLLHQYAAQLLMRLAGSEQHPVGHDDGRAPARFEQPQEQGQEQQFGFLGFDDVEQVLGGVLVVEAAREWGIGQDHGIGLLVAGMILGKGI